MPPSPDDYVELRARSAFSFLEGASNPEELVEQAARRGHRALALGDRDGVSGLPRFHQAARAAGLQPILGAEVHLENGPRLRLLVESSLGWQNLCQLLTRGQAGRPKGEAAIDYDALEEHAAGLTLLMRGDPHLSPFHLDRNA